MGFFLKKTLDLIRIPEKLREYCINRDTLIATAERKKLIKLIESSLYPLLFQSSAFSLLKEILANWNLPEIDFSSVKLKNPEYMQHLQPRPPRYWFTSED